MILALQERGLFPEDVPPARAWYEREVSTKLNEIRNGAFSTEFIARYPKWRTEYSTRFQLLTAGPPHEISFVTKPFDSVINKMYRSAILSEPPSDSPFAMCFVTFDDLVRITLASPYGDGPKFLSSKLCALADELDLSHDSKERANNFGYYAIHFTFQTVVDILSPSFEMDQTHLTAEIQLTTQLQLSLRTITHKLYEARRLRPQAGSDWKWDFANALFRPSYTGHTLHLLESLLLDMKNEAEATDET